MAKSPQLKNGYTQIANEIIEALARLNISSYERRIIDIIIRKTWGFVDNSGNHKIWDRIAYSQFSNYTGISKQNVHRAIKKLIDKTVIERKPLSKRGDYEYRLLKDYEKWIGLSSIQTTKDKHIVIHTDYKEYSIQTTKLSSIQTTTKERKKPIKKPSNRKKDSRLEYSAEAERLANLFLKKSGVTLKDHKEEHTLEIWIDSIVKLHRIDKEEYSGIEEVIRWVTDDKFWRANCLSPAKFRRVDKDGTRYFDVFAYKMKPPKTEEPIRPSEVLV